MFDPCAILASEPIRVLATPMGAGLATLAVVQLAMLAALLFSRPKLRPPAAGAAGQAVAGHNRLAQAQTHLAELVAAGKGDSPKAQAHRNAIAELAG